MKNLIILSSVIGDDLRSRFTMQNILPLCKKGEQNVFDFTGVRFISRSFADELYTVAEQQHIEYINMTGIVQQMYDVVSRGRKQKRIHPQNSTDIIYIKTPDEFAAYTSQF